MICRLVVRKLQDKRLTQIFAAVAFRNIYQFIITEVSNMPFVKLFSATMKNA